MDSLVVPRSAVKWIALQCNSRLVDFLDCPDVRPVLSRLERLYTWIDSYGARIINTPSTVLEVGCGLGRVSLWLYWNLLDWRREATHFYLLDGTGGEEQIAGVGGKTSEDTLYCDMKATAEFCRANNFYRFTILDEGPGKLRPYIHLSCDLIYSFKAVGFHWDVGPWIERLRSSLKPGGYFIFGTRSRGYLIRQMEKRGKRTKGIKVKLDFLNRQFSQIRDLGARFDYLDDGTYACLVVEFGGS